MTIYAMTIDESAASLVVTHELSLMVVTGFRLAVNTLMIDVWMHDLIGSRLMISVVIVDILSLP